MEKGSVGVKFNIIINVRLHLGPTGPIMYHYVYSTSLQAEAFADTSMKTSCRCTE